MSDPSRVSRSALAVIVVLIGLTIFVGAGASTKLSHYFVASLSSLFGTTADEAVQLSIASGVGDDAAHHPNAAVVDMLQAEMFNSQPDSWPGKNVFVTTDLVSLRPAFPQPADQKIEGAEQGEDEGEAADDLIGALEYEFNMTKDPATGKIPEGIFNAERAQANAIVERQINLDIPELASYSFVGPDNLGGRTRAIAYDVRYNGTTNRTILAGGVSGGVYKSIDDGATWVRKSPLGAHFSCTSIAQDPRPTFQDTWYYTVGESSGNSTSGSGAFYFGDGVYKSSDNGETWARQTASNTGTLESFDDRSDLITRVVVNPVNGDVYIASVAAILRSTNGGGSWSIVLSGTFSNAGQVADIAVTSTGLFYAGFAGSNSVGADGVWTSTTGASGSWTRISGHMEYQRRR